MTTLIFLGGLGAGAFLTSMLFLALMLWMAGNRGEAKATEAKYEKLMKVRNGFAEEQTQIFSNISEALRAMLAERTK